MTSYNQDRKWKEAKLVVGDPTLWLYIISYYRKIGGQNVFVYIIGNGEKSQIIDFFYEDSEDDILLINKQGEPYVDTYENVDSNRKLFQFNDKVETTTIQIENKTFNVTKERQN